MNPKRLLILPLSLLLVACQSSLRTTYEYDAAAVQQNNYLTAVVVVTFCVCVAVCVVALAITDYLKNRRRP